MNEQLLDDIFDTKQIEILRENGVKTWDLHLVSGNEISQYNYLKDAYTDGEFLIFNTDYIAECQKTIYYMGAENQAELDVKYKGVVIYSNISSGRLERFLTDENRMEYIEYASDEDEEPSQPIKPETAVALCATSKADLKKKVFELLNLSEARQVANWAKKQGMKVDLCYKEHWALVLQKIAEVSA